MRLQIAVRTLGAQLQAPGRVRYPMAWALNLALVVLIRRNSILNSVILIICALLGLASNVHAQSTPFTWNNSTNNWSSPANWLDATNSNYVPTSAATTNLIFGGNTSYTATNDIGSGTFLLNSLTFSNTGATNLAPNAAANTLTFGGGSSALTVAGGAGAVTVSNGIVFSTNTTVANSSSNPLTLSGAITYNAQAVTNYTGSGNIIASAAQTFSSNSVMYYNGTGTLTLGPASSTGIAFGTGVAVLNNGSFGASSTGTLILKDGGAYSGSGNLNLFNYSANAFNVGNLGPLSGGVNVLAGTVTFLGDTSGDLFGSSVTLNVASGATFDFNGNGEIMGAIAGAGIIKGAAITMATAGAQTWGGSIQGAITFSTSTSTANYTFTGINTSTGILTAGAGSSVSLGSGATTGSWAGAITDTGSIILNRSDSANYVGGIISGVGTVTKTGTGTVTFTVANSYSGGTIVNAGGLAGIAGSTTKPFGTGPVTINGGTLQINQAASGASASTIGALTVGGGANVLINWTSINTTLTIASLARGTSGNGTAVFNTGGGTLNTNSIFTFTTAPTALSQGILSPWSVAQTTSSTGDFINLSSKNLIVATYGSTDVTASASSAIVNQSTTVNNTTSAAYNAFALKASAAIALGSGTGTLTIGSIGTTPAGLILNGGSISGGATTGGLVFGSNEAAIYSNGTTSISSTINNTGGLTFFGPGTLTLSGNNSTTYTGVVATGFTTFNGGVVSISADTALGGTLTGGSTAIPLQFGGGTLQITGSSSFSNTRNISLTGIGTIDVLNPAGVTLNGAITGAGILAKTNTGTLILTSTSSSYGGGTLINGGVLSVAADTNLGTGNLVFGGGTLSITGSSAFSSSKTITLNSGGGTLNITNTAGATFSGVVSGTGALTNSAGALTLSGSNYYSGGTNLTGGSINISNATGTGLGTGTLTVGTGAANAATVSSNNVAFLYASSTGPITLTNAIILPAPTSTTVYTLEKGEASSTSGNNLQLTGVISGGNSSLRLELNATTAGDFTTTYQFSNSGNTFTGNIILNRGGLQIDSNAALGAAANTVTFAGNTNSPFIFNSSMTYTHNTIINISTNFNTEGNTVFASGTISGSNSLVNVGAGTLILSGPNSFSGGLFINSGTVQFSADNNIGSTSVANTVTINGGILEDLGTASISPSFHTFQIGSVGGFLKLDGTAGSGSNLKIAAGKLTGSGTLFVTGTSNLVLLGANTFTGAWQINGGFVEAQNSTALGTGVAGNTITVNNNGELSGSTATIANNITLTNGGILSVNSTSNGASGNTFSGNITVSGLVSIIPSDYTDATGRAMAIVGPINDGSSSGGLVVSLTNNGFTSSAGTLFLSGTNMYSGGTTLNAGTVSVSADSSLGTGNLTFGGGILQITGNVGFASSKNIILNAAGGTIDVTNSAGAIISGAISGAGGLTKTSNGTLTLSNSNSYNGTTLVSGGTLILSNSNTNSGATTISGGSLQVYGGTSQSSAITVGTGTLLSVVNPTTAATPALLSNLAFGSSPSDSMTLNLNAGSTSWTPTTTLLTVGGTLTTNGTTTINIATTTSLSTGFYNLIGYNGSIGGSGYGGFILGNLPNPRVIGNLYNNTTSSVIQLDVTGIDSPKWTGATNGVWDINNTPNWQLISAGSQTTYLDGDKVLFDDSAAGATNISLNLTVSPTLSNFANTTLTYTVSGSGKISGMGSLAVSNGGTLFLDTNNDYSGGTSISTGSTLYIGGTSTAGIVSSGTSGAIAGNVADSGVLIFNRSDTSTYAGAITGSGSVTQAGGGTLILTGANNYGGGTTISAGTLQIDNGGATASLTGNILDNGALVFDRSDSPSFGGNINGTGTVTQAGGGTLTLSGANNYSGGTTINAGILSVGSGGNLGSNTITLSGGALAASGTTAYAIANNINLNSTTNTIGSNNSAGVTLSGTVSGNALTVNGTGLLILSQGNNYSGGTTFNSGILSINADGNLGSGNLTFNGGTLQTTGSSAFLSNKNAVFNALGGTIDVENSVSVMATLSGNLSGAGALTKIGPGILSLGGGNSYGATNFNAGTVSVSAPGNLGSGNLVFGGGALQVIGSSAFSSAKAITVNAAGGTFDIQNSAGATFSGPISGVGNLTQISAGTLTLMGTNTSFTGNWNLNGGVLSIATAANLASTTSSTQTTNFNGGTLQITASFSTGLNIQSFNFAGPGTIDVAPNVVLGKEGLSGSGALTKTDGGTLSIQSGGSTTFNGTIAVNSGALRETSNRLPNSGTITVANGGTFWDFDSSTFTVGSPLSIGTGSSLILNGNGAASGTLATVTYPVTGAFLHSLDEPGSSAGGINVPITLATTSRFVETFGTSGTRTGSDSVSDTFLQAISGPGSLIKDGEGTMILAVANTYGTSNGSTIISNGILRISGGNDRLPISIPLQIGEVGSSNSGTFDLFGNNQTVAGLTTAGSGTANKVINSNTTTSGTLTINASSANNYAGNLGATGGNNFGLTTTGSATVTLSGTGTYTGPTNVQNGTLQLGSSSALPIGTALTLGATTVGGILDLNSFTATVSSLGTSGAGGTLNQVIDSSTSGGGVLNIAYNGGTTDTFGGQLGGGGGSNINFSVNHTGTGSVAFTQASTYSGGTSISGGGTLVVSNTTGSATGSGTVTVGTATANSGTLTGTGLVAALLLNSGGSVTPGTAGVGTLTANGNVTFSGGTFTVNLSGGSGAGAYGQLVTTGVVNLGTTTIISYTAYTAATPNQVFDIVKGGTSLSGAFANAPEGLLFTNSNSNENYNIYYGDYTALPGDVVIAPVTVVPEPMSVVLIGGLGLGVSRFVRRRRSKMGEVPISA